MVEARHLRKVFRDAVAVDDVSFDLRGGEIFGLLGPNGAGKTTTIRMLLNILPPDSGKVLYYGKPFSELLRGHFGYLPEERGLYRKSRVIDVATYFAELRGLKRHLARKATEEWLERFELLASARRRVEELSKGNQQKLQFIAAVLHNPRIVVLDEPFSGLDPINQQLLHDIFLELKGEGKIVVFSTHQMEQAERLCDTICLVNHGRVVLEGSLPDIRRRFSQDTVLVEYSGSGAAIAGLPGVAEAVVYGNTAEIRLTSGCSPTGLLKNLVDKVEIRKFEVRQPTLHSIFLQTVGGSPSPGGIPG